MTDLDLNNKAAARSKWRASRKHQRGRGHSRHNYQPSRNAKPSDDLGNNYDRYSDEDEGPMPSESIIRRSQGGDIAEWLAEMPIQDSTFYARQRVNFNQDVGLPSADADAFQGLSFDLDGLARCLAQLPLHEVLRIQAPEGDQSSHEYRSTDEIAVKSTEPPGGDDASVSRVDPWAAKSEDRGIPDSGEHQQPTPPLRTETAVRRETRVEEQKELDNEMPRATVHATPSAEPLLPDQGGGKHGVVGEVDLELEALLSLSTSATQPLAPKVATTKADEPGGSLEDWLDTL